MDTSSGFKITQELTQLNQMLKASRIAHHWLHFFCSNMPLACIDLVLWYPALQRGHGNVLR